MTKTYSSVREALESGILESGHAHRLNQRAINGGGRPSRRSQFRSQSYTLATAECQSNSIHAVDTRFSMSSQSSFLGSVREDTIAIEGLRLSSDPPPQEIDLSEMTSEDIERLKVEDPFMYYSIPEVHSRFYNNFGDDDDDDDDDDAPMIPEDPEGRGTATAAADRGADRGADGAPPPPSSSNSNRRPPRIRPTPLHASCPAGMLANAEIALAAVAVPPPERRSSVVRKCRRLSVEQHPMLMCRDFLRRVSDTVSEEGQAGGGGAEEREQEEENLLLSALMMDLSDDDSEYDFDMNIRDDA